MISVGDAYKIIMDQETFFGSEEVLFTDSIGRVLAEDITADRDFPPFDRVMMDGIAISHKEFQGSGQTFKIQAVQAAGQTPLTLETGSCIEIMTGAVLPFGADTIVRYEDISIETAVAKINVESIKQGQNIHLRGEDRKQADVLIPKNTRIGPAEIGVLSTVGKSEVLVKAKPKVAIISTGDELVPIEKIPEPHQIRMSNSYSVKALLDALPIESNVFHLKDDKIELKEKIKNILKGYDVLVLSGAVSKGSFDYLPEVLEELSVKKLFHKVAQRPGKPFWFGRGEEGEVVFALPGNPVSTFMCTARYVRPWLIENLGLTNRKEFALLAEDFFFKPSLHYYLQVSLRMDTEGKLWAKPRSGKGSGDLANLTVADAFLELPPDKNEFKKGDVFPIYRFRT